METSRDVSLRLLRGEAGEMADLQQVLEAAPVTAEPHQGPGIGKAAYCMLESKVVSWRGCTRIRLSVVRANEGALPFWQRLGFTPTGEVKPYRNGSVVSEVVILAKALRGTSVRP